MWRPAILQKAESALLDEKAAKLKGLARLLDQELGEGFEPWLAAAGVPADAPAPERLAALREGLRPLTDRIAAAFPNVGLGYFASSLDCIVAYAPSEKLGYLVGVSPAPDHVGRLAMEQRAARIAIGSMVRGDAMNCMHPLIRDGRVIGFSFANEAVEDIYRQIQSGGGRGAAGLEAAHLFGLPSLAVFASTSQLSAESIRVELAAAVKQGILSEPVVRPLMHGLQQVGQYVRLFLDSLNAGVALVDHTGRVAFCNAALSRMAGESGTDLHGRPWQQVAAEMGLTLTDPEQADLSTTGHQLLRGSLSFGGATIPVDLLVAPLPGLPGQPGFRLYLLEDTDRTRRESEYFERAERLALAGQLATAIAHEIRNPLTVVAGSIQLIPDRIEDHEFLCSLAHIAGEELGRINRTIQGLLGFARYSEPERTYLDLNRLLAQAVEFLAWYAHKRGVRVVSHYAPGALYVYGDGEHLRQAFLNLMMNGIQAMEAGGQLSIHTDHIPGSRSARITIADEGVGIPQEQLSKIWEVFYSTKPGGTGLGLPVVQRIIDEHRGYIEVDSTPGRGTAFTVLLPLANSPTRPMKEG